jgi:hypothetical protein
MGDVGEKRRNTEDGYLDHEEVWDIPKSDLKFSGKQLGKGSFGTVELGSLYGLPISLRVNLTPSRHRSCNKDASYSR